MTRPVVAFVLPDLNSGGAERAALNLAHALPDCTTRVVAEWRRGDLLGDPLAADVQFLSRAGDRLGRARRVANLVRWLRAERPDVVVSMLSPAVATLAARMAGVPVIHWLQAPLLRTTGADRGGLGPRAKRRILRAVGNASALLLGATPGLCDECRSIGIASSRLAVLPNGLTLPDAGALPDPPRWRGGRIVCVGRLERPKRQDLLIEALTSAGLADAHLVLVGSGSDEQVLRAQASRLGVADRVTFTGFVASPHEALADADVFALPTEYEGFGNVIVEAMVHGMPVVVSDVPYGPRYILRDGDLGSLVAAGTAQAWADALAEALAAGPLPQAMRRAVVARAREFELEAIAGRFRDELERVLSPPAPAA